MVYLYQSVLKSALTNQHCQVRPIGYSSREGKFCVSVLIFTDWLKQKVLKSQLMLKCFDLKLFADGK